MAANYQQTEDQFMCPICLVVFTDPVTIPCGHNFCKSCITHHWSNKVQYDCPMCKESFPTKPELRVNTLLSEMAVQLRQSAQHELKPGDVSCGACSGTRLKALKSCLVCLTSFCKTHLEPHLTAPGLKRHQLIDPVENLEGRMCTKHEKPLELFCKTDQTCVCTLCFISDHKTHMFVPLKEEYEDKKAELGKTEAKLQQMIQDREQKVQVIKRSVQHSKEDADRQIAEVVQVFTALKEFVDRYEPHIIRATNEKQRRAKNQADDFIKELQQEICELKKRRTEVEQLSLSEDHLHLLQGLNTWQLPSTKDWSQVSVTPTSCEGSVRRAVSQLEELLRKEIQKLDEADLKRIQKYEVDMALDPDTAHRQLVLSDNGKQVNGSDVKKLLPENPERFSNYSCVLAKRSFSSGRFYYEVQVQGKTDWSLGVVRRSIDRKRPITWTPKKGYWTIRLTKGNQYYSNEDPPVRLSLKSQPQKVGVFVDVEAALVSFYNVDAATLIHSFTGCSFTEKLFPLFDPGGNSKNIPLIIAPVRVKKRLLGETSTQTDSKNPKQNV